MRETQNIFFYLSKGYYDSAWFWFKSLIPFTKFYNCSSKTTRKDTWYGFKQITICKLLGHKLHMNENKYQEYIEIRCSRCSKWIKDLSYEETIQYKREQKLKRIIK